MIEPQIVTKTVKTVIDGQVVSLKEVEVQDPSLILSTYEVSLTSGDESATVELFYLGEGVISITNPNPTALTVSYNSGSKIITLTNNLTSGDDPVDVNLSVSLSRSGSYTDESVTLAVNCSVKLDPTFSLKAWKNSIDYYMDFTDVPYYSDYTSEIPNLETNNITIDDARYLGSDYNCYVYIMVETNSDGAVGISGEAGSCCTLSSQDNGRYLIVIQSNHGNAGTSLTESLIITVGESFVTLNITFVNHSGRMEPF